jgi:Cu(I)/Ag(I) efflux system periplasmic protein CusF
MKLILVVATLLCLALTPALQAQTHATKSKATVAMTHATVVALDMTSQRVLLKHGPIPSLHMGPMTMEFVVQDAKMLQRLKIGSKLRFVAVQEADDYLITRLQVLK